MRTQAPADKTALRYARRYRNPERQIRNRIEQASSGDTRSYWESVETELRKLRHNGVPEEPEA